MSLFWVPTIEYNDGLIVKDANFGVEYLKQRK